jgi:DNA adenine methylase
MAAMRSVALAPEAYVQPRPFLKWAGGKAKLAPQIMARFPDRFRRYHEPFIGGGAVFFALGPREATLSDVNADLITTYRAIRDHVESLIEVLLHHRASEEDFYRIRAVDPGGLSLIESAARTIYLNRTCFNGLYRVNRRGQFNVPFGRYANPRICNAENLRAVSDALQGVDLRVEDAMAIGRRARRGDLVYFDPPYDPISPTASFTSYAKTGFGRTEQERLAEVFAHLAERGVHAVLSNSDTPFVRKLYKRFEIETVYARRAINSRADRRGPVPEVLVSTR